MRVVLDTNILLSALIRADSIPGRILDAWFDDRFVLLSHPLQLEELRTVTRRPQIRALIRPSEAGRLVNHSVPRPSWSSDCPISDAPRTRPTIFYWRCARAAGRIISSPATKPDCWRSAATATRSS